MEFINKFLHHLLSDKIINIASLFIAFLTFLLAIRVRKEFLKNQTKTKQIEVVNDLVMYLNKTKIRIESCEIHKKGGSSTYYNIYYNIFELGDLVNTKEHIAQLGDISFPKHNDKEVFFNYDTNQICDIKNYIDNPFLPKMIADELLNFYSSQFKVIKRDEQKELEFILLTSQIFEEGKIEEEINNRDLIWGNAEALKTWLNLKAFSGNLTKKIKEWFIDNGVDDLNLRIDYKN